MASVDGTKGTVTVGIALVLAVSVTACAPPALVDTGDTGKDLCILRGIGCPKRQPTMDEMIGRIQHEIDRGKAVYSEKELQILRMKLEEYEELRYKILYGTSG